MGWGAAFTAEEERRSGRSRSVEASEGLGDAGDDLTLDELLLTTSGLAEGGGGEAVDLAQGALRLLVQSREGVIGEQGALAAGGVEAETDVLCRVRHSGGGDQEAVVNAGEQGPVGPSREVGFELGEADEDERQEGLRVPLMIEQDVQVPQHVGVKQMRLVEEEDRMEPVFS